MAEGPGQLAQTGTFRRGLEPGTGVLIYAIACGAILGTVSFRDLPLHQTPVIHPYATPSIRSTVRNDATWLPSASSQTFHQPQPSQRCWLNPGSRNRKMTMSSSRRDLGSSVWRHDPLGVRSNPANAPPLQSRRKLSLGQAAQGGRSVHRAGSRLKDRDSSSPPRSYLSA